MGMVGLHFFPVSSSRPAKWPGSAGGDWKNFNASQRQRRADMVCLYGSTKRLVPLSKGYAVTGSLDNSVHALFGLQVSGVVRHRFQGYRANPIVNPISESCTSSHATVTLVSV